MGHEVTLGGDRLGSGKKQKIYLSESKRSTHDLSSAWRSSMSAGTLVPFMKLLALPGDSFDIDLECEVMTLPTRGPLFGSFKVQLDVFEVPMRLYQAKLHMNLLGVGLDMEAIKLPQWLIKAERSLSYEDNTQINPSSIAKYLGISGIGRPSETGTADLERLFNAVPFLGYWDIFKQYYSNKMEDDAFVIHNDMSGETVGSIFQINVYIDNVFQYDIAGVGYAIESWQNPTMQLEYKIAIPFNLQENPSLQIDTSSLFFNDSNGNTFFCNEYFGNSTQYRLGNTIVVVFSSYVGMVNSAANILSNNNAGVFVGDPALNGIPRLVSFPLANIDTMRKTILQQVNQVSPLIINGEIDLAPYNLCANKGEMGYSIRSSQEGLAVKTYQSDLFNNWLNNEFVSGTNGINEITSVDTSEGFFTIDAINLAKKVYYMMNRIVLSGGTYDDWLNAVYTHERARSVENPIYHGSYIRELAFQEVISNADSTANGTLQPLGTLGGRGSMTDKRKGGKMRIKVHEPSYIIGIVSLTPRIDYSQGNDWDMNLRSFNDFHKPQLDEIGFQDLITDQMAYFDTTINNTGILSFKSAGKQPAWLNYMTDINKTFGNFAIANSEMWMTLNRRYEAGANGIMDLTTYIDPVKFNQIFAQTSLDAQNFWVQIGKGITVRRQMSAKVIPNL